MLESARKHFGEPVFVVLWNLGYAHIIQLDFVLSVKRTAALAKFKQLGALFLRRDQQYIEVRRRSPSSA